MNNVLQNHMGENFGQLASLLQEAHTGSKRLEGMVEVKRGGLLANIICTVFRFPRAASQAHLVVECEHTADAMHWKRHFDGFVMESHFAGKGEYLIEYLGPLALAFKAEEQHGELHYRFIKTHMWGLPLPDFLSPQVLACEKEVNGQYCFNVEVRMFLVGMVIAYGGVLLVKQCQGKRE